ncbi:MAG: hypothetical protein AVDCRST_MAG68-4833 [uncultured Gemmatimonadetes bacterium]|uniref:Uncharacterized protein n=1 Tax=uncultured Gemmatimonadota bacterium TaxID=203437 RepID=A0A6J4MQ85_9BACT|nr:MAG: hypothetical protein AVDCRST_MAG68-4833 [uncultured Gemmatimonadota bacterium]
MNRLLLLVALAACGAPRPAPHAAPPPPPPVSSTAAMDFRGQRVLILPVQSAEAVGTRDEATSELVFALRERDERTQWVTPDQLRRALRGTPGYAADPGTLPDDAFLHHGERTIVDPLGSVVRRYSALTDTRVVVIPRAARWIAGAAGGRVRMSAAVVDARNGRVLWFGDAEGEPRPAFGREALASAAAALAARMLAAERR